MEREDAASNDDRNSPPILTPDSPGSSVSTRLQEEYTELLKYAVILPSSDAEDTMRASPNNSAFQIVTGKNTSSQENYGEGTDEDRNTNAIFPNYCQRFLRKNSSDRTKKQQVDEDSGKREDAKEEDQASQQADQDPTSSDASSVKSSLLDPSMTQMSHKLDSWLGKLKSDILDEFCQLTLRNLELQQEKQGNDMKSLQAEKTQLQQEVNRLNDLIHTCEESITRKDTLIENLSKALAEQKEKVHMGNAFYNWRATLDEQKREAFTSKLAERHHERQLCLKVFKAWFCTIQVRWKTQVERQCQNQAQNVCKQLSTDYENKISQLNSTIQSLEQKVDYLQQERESYAESVKKAFMRGVCALNMEAMSAFTDDDLPPMNSDGTAAWPRDSDPSVLQQDINFNSCDTNIKEDAQTKSLPPTLMTSVTPGAPLTSSLPDPVRSSLKVNQQSMTITGLAASQNLRKTKPKGKPTSSSTRPSSAGSVIQGQGLAPPMATVVVERHQPITKQTVGKATALKYPKSPKQEAQKPRSARNPVISSQNFRPIAGQTAVKPPPSIKVVD